MVKIRKVPNTQYNREFLDASVVHNPVVKGTGRNNCDQIIPEAASVAGEKKKKKSKCYGSIGDLVY